MEHVNRLYRNRDKRPTVIKIAGMVIGGIILAVIFAFLFGYFVMLLWNWIMPILFGLPEITYWMGFGIILLARLIFGNLTSGHHKNDSNRKNHFRYKCRSYKDQKWQHYDEFWDEEGEKAFDNYIERKNVIRKNDVTESPAE